MNELKLKMDVKEKEIKLLSGLAMVLRSLFLFLASRGQYVRKLEEEARIRDGQRERLLTDAGIARSKFKQTDA